MDLFRIGLVADTSSFPGARRNVQGLQKDMAGLQGQAKKTADGVRLMQNAFRQLAGVLGTAEIISLIDEYRNLEAQLRLVTASSIELRIANKGILDIAQATGQQFGALATVYARTGRASRDLGISQTDLLRVTEALSNAALVSGASAQEAGAAFIQLSQGLASGTLRGDELRSVLEQLPRVAQAIADGAGVAFGDLRKVAEEGGLSAKVVVDALLDQFDRLKLEAEEIPETFGRAFSRIKNALLISLGESTFFNEISDAAISALNEIAAAVPRVIDLIDDLADSLDQAFGDGAAVNATALTAIAAAGASIGFVFGPLAGVIAAAGGAVALFNDDIAQFLIGSNDFLLALRALGAEFAEFFDFIFAKLKELNDFLGNVFAGLAGAVQNAVSEFLKINEALARIVFGDEIVDAFKSASGDLINAAGDLGAKAGSKLASEISDAVAGVGEQIASDLRAEAARIKLNDFGAALDGIDDLKDSINEIADLSPLENLPADVRQAISAARDEIIKAGKLEVGVSLAEANENAGELIGDLADRFDLLASSIGLAFSELDEGSRKEAIQDLKDVLSGGGLSERSNETIKAFIDQLERVNVKAALAGNSLKKMGEAVGVFDDLTKEIGALQSALDAFRDGGKKEFDLAVAEAKIRAEVAKLEKEAAKDKADFNRQAAEDLVLQRDVLKEQNEAVKDLIKDFNLADIKTEIADVQALIEAGAEGGKQAIDQKKIELELQKQITELQILGSKVGLDPETIKEIEAALSRLSKGKQDLKKLEDAAVDFSAIIDQGLNRAVGDFVDALLDGGADFGDLISSVLKDITRNILAGPNGILTSIVNPNAQAIDLEKFFGSKKIDGQLEKRFTKIFGDFGDVLGKVSKDLGEAFKGIAEDLGEAAAGATAGFAGFKIGSGVADFINGDQGETGGKVGGAVGGGVGFAVAGPIGAFIGSAVGSFFGDLFGGLFGRKTATGQFNFDSNSISGLKDSKKDSRNDRRDVILDTAAEAIKALADALGANFASDLSLLVQAGKKSITTQIVDERTGRVISSASSGASDVAGAVDAAIQLALQSVLKGGDQLLTSIASAFAAAKVPAEKLVDSISKIGSVLEFVAPPSTQFLDTLKEVAKVFDEAERAAAGAASALGELAKAEFKVLDALGGKFDKELDSQIRELRNPQAQALFDILENQSLRLQEVQELNKALAAVAPVSERARVAAEAQDRLAKAYDLSSAELQSFLEGIASTPEAFLQAREAINAFKDDLIDRGFNFDEITDQLDFFRSTLAASFDKATFGDILELSNPTLSAFKKLLEEQKAAQEFAEEIGADVFAVIRRNELQRQNFFKSLSEKQLLELGDFLGIIEDFTGEIAVELAKLDSAFDIQIDKISEYRDELLKTADANQKAADSIADLIFDLNQQFFPGSPDAQLESLKSQFGDLLDQTLSGDLNAADKLPEAAKNLIDLGRDLFSSTDEFFTLLDFVQNGLESARESRQSAADEARDQAEIALDQLGVLESIRDILKAADSVTSDLIAPFLAQIDASNLAVIEPLTRLIELVAAQEAETIATNAALSQLAAGGIPQSALDPFTPSSTIPTAPAAVQATPDFSSLVGLFQSVASNDTKNLSAQTEALNGTLINIRDEMQKLNTLLARNLSPTQKIA